MPSFTATLKPLFSPRGSTRTSGKLWRTKATEASVEPLSTNTVSKSEKDCLRKESKHERSKLSPFQLGITTVTRGDGKGLSGPPLPFSRQGVDFDLRGQTHNALKGASILGRGNTEGCRLVHPI